MTSIFEGQPPKTRPKFQSKQGSVGLQVYTYDMYFFCVNKLAASKLW